MGVAAAPDTALHREPPCAPERDHCPLWLPPLQEPGGQGCLLELTGGGGRALLLQGGGQRTYLEDGDTVVLRGYCQGDGYCVGFGECSGCVLPVLG